MIPSKDNFKLNRFWPHSRKNYSHFKTFGATLMSFQAELLFLSKILNQGNSPKCTAYDAVSVRSSMKGKDYDPDAQWQAELAFLGVKDAPGTDILTQMSVGVERGFLPLPGAGAPVMGDRATAYFWVDKADGMDVFDSMRTAISQIQGPLSAGVGWYADWNVEGGIAPFSFQNLMGGHAIKIAGWKTIDNVPYLVVQNSWGDDVGDNGLFYFSRAMANKIFVEGIAYWSDSTVPVIKKLGLLSALWANLVALWNQVHAPGVAPAPQPEPKPDPIPPDPAPIVPAPVDPPAPVTPEPLLWNTSENARHSVRVICDDEGLLGKTMIVDGVPHAMKDVLTACVHLESTTRNRPNGFDPLAINHNRDKNGKIESTDYGICQINDFWHIGAGKDFPSSDYVLQNPAASVRFMCKMFLAGKASLWVSYSSGGYKKYL